MKYFIYKTINIYEKEDLIADKIEKELKKYKEYKVVNINYRTFRWNMSDDDEYQVILLLEKEEDK